jgi:hypothetical protein
VRSLLFAAALSALTTCAAFAADGKIVKVLPHLLDKEGRHVLSPSLFERDAYQARLRKHPELVSGMRFDVQWKASGNVESPLKLRIELRTANNASGAAAIREIEVTKPRLWTRWSGVEIKGQEYTDLGEVLAWRASLVEGDKVVAEQRSFLW